MTGVEILAMEEVAVTFGFDWSIFWAALTIVAALVTIFVGVVCIPELGWWSFVVGAIAGCFVGACFGTLFARNTLPLEYETQYKVTISDDVSMNSFLERYEIIDQEGKIYTVRDKND